MDNRLNALMQDTTLRKAFGARVKELRKAYGWSQKQLAAQLDIRFQRRPKGFYSRVKVELGEASRRRV